MTSKWDLLIQFIINIVSNYRIDNSDVLYLGVMKLQIVFDIIKIIFSEKKMNFSLVNL